MEQRVIGNTGKKISIIGLGTEYLSKQSPEVIRQTLRLAFDNDVNYFDLVFAFPEFLQILGEELKKSNKKVIIGCHIGCGLVNGKHRKIREPIEAEQAFNKVLEALNVDKVEFGIIQFVSPKEYEKIMKPNQLYDLARIWRDEGKIEEIGISTHDPNLGIQAILSQKFSFILTQVNFFTAGIPERQNMLHVAKQNNIGVIAIKPYAGGFLLKAGKKVKIPGYKIGGSSVNLTIPSNLASTHCLSYVIDYPGVICTIPGSKSPEELESNLSTLNGTDSDRDWTKFTQFFQNIN